VLPFSFAACNALGADNERAAIQKIVPMGPLIARSTLAGERREDNISPHGAMGWQFE